ncbi:hypothetical protein, partial [Streptomyces albidoflavus]|uniref:hypothetical protein n=1 Tax=Streptomyces albidoflavus TaxID=1886 RepID=UPI000A597C50
SGTRSARIPDTLPTKIAEHKTRSQTHSETISYRTKDLILAEYDRMAAAGVSLTTPLVDGENYTSTLTPPPGHGPRHEGTGE